eukprot:gene13928-18681_t
MENSNFDSSEVIGISTASSVVDSSLNVAHLSYKPNKRSQYLDKYDYIRYDILPTYLGSVIPSLKGIRNERAKEIPLNNINFGVKSGELCVLLGSNDARHSVIELITGRKLSGVVEGNITVKGSKIADNSDYYSHVAFVKRKIIYTTGFTFKDTLYYAARLRMSNATSKEIDERVLEIAEIMNLKNCLSNVIPEYPAARGIEGSDMRRLAIASEIIALPPIIVIDEPAYGFESLLAVQILHCLQTLAADKGCAILCSMDKPNLYSFTCFTKTILLSDGYTIYAGPTQQIEEYFSSANLGYSMKKGTDLVEFVLDIASGVERPIGQRVIETGTILQEKFELSELAETVKSGIVSAFSKEFFSCLGYARFDPYSVQIKRAGVVIERAIYMKLRDFEVIKKSLGGAILVSLLVGYLQYNQSDYGYFAINLITFPYLNTANTTATLFFTSAFSFGKEVLNVHVVCQKIRSFRSEQAAGLCNLPSFVLGTVISEVPFAIFYMLVFGNIIYYMTGMNIGVDNYFFFMETIILNNLIGITTAFLLSAILRKELAVRDCYLVLVLLMILMSGFAFQLPHMTSYIASATVVNPVRWTFEALLNWKFSSHYKDGLKYLTPFGFNAFDHGHIFEILLNFLLISNSVTILFLLPKPLLLRRKETVEVIGVSRGMRDSVESGDSFDMEKPVTRPSQTVMPLLFRKESSVTGAKSNLSTNLSQMGVKEGNHGPTVLFKDITYRIRDRSSSVGYKTILNNVTGLFDWGKLSMIMGAPGSGKSSLLHILAGDSGIGTEVTGEIRFDNAPVDPTIPLYERCGLVEVDDEQMRDLTVKQILKFACLLRSPINVKKEIIEENIKNTIEILHLSEVVDKKSKHLAPGELRRLSIAEEMVNGPQLLLIDEPSTGLSISDQVVLFATFREMVNGDRTVIATIDQPTSQVFNLFDTLLLLSKGRVIYFGSVSGAANYFMTSPFEFSYTNYGNPADFLLDISAGLVPDGKGNAVDEIEIEKYHMKSDVYSRITQRFKPSSFANNPMIKDNPGLSFDNINDADISAERMERSSINKPQGLPSLALPPLVRAMIVFFTEYVTSFPSFQELRLRLYKGRVLLTRSFLALVYRPELVMGSIIVHTMIGVIFGWIMGLSTDTTATYNVISFFAVSSLILLFATVQIVYYMFFHNKVFLKEHSRGLYTNVVHWAVDFLPLYLLRAISGILFAVVSYAMIGLSQKTDIFGFFIFTFIILMLISTMLAEVIVVTFSEIRSSYIVFPAVAFVEFMFSGLFIKF